VVPLLHCAAVPERYDVVIVGGGIVGLATAYSLTLRGVARLLVLEAESQVAAHQTGHNSGVIHSGLYYPPRSLKAATCTTGREALYGFCAAQGIPHERCGKLVVATSPAELPRLHELERRGRANGLQGLRRLAASEIREHEPEAAGVAALWVAETGITDFAQVAQALAAAITAAGAEVRTAAPFRRLRRRDGALRLEIGAGAAVVARHLVNCAGLESDRVARRCGLRPQVRIVPFRGEYFKLAASRRGLVRGLIYPVPDDRYPFLGVHFTRRIDGAIEAGPNAVLSWRRGGYGRRRFRTRDAAATLFYPGFWRFARRHWRAGWVEARRAGSREAFARDLQRLVPALRTTDLEPGGSGVRAQAVDRAGRLVDDFEIQEGPGMTHVLNTPSPAATAALTIGQGVANIVLRQLGN
jgi:L-2-hydroxyglutarate oxidase